MIDNRETMEAQEHYEESHLSNEQTESSNDPFAELFAEANSSHGFGEFVESEEQPIRETAPPPQAPNSDPNDYVRARHWQSEHDKMKNKYDALEQELESIKAASVKNEEQVAPQEDLSFPDPPKEPERPYNFNMEEALSDPSSQSAEYYRRYSKYQQDVMDYNILKTEYVRSQVELDRKREADERKARADYEEAYNNEVSRRREIATTLMREKGADQHTAADFIKKMSNPDVSLDDLWTLYQIQSNRRPVDNRREEYGQIRRSQANMPPVSSMPSSANKDIGRSPSDILMDSIIGEFNKRNPFGSFWRINNGYIF